MARKFIKYFVLLILVSVFAVSCRLQRELYKDSNKDKFLLNRVKLDLDKHLSKSDSKLSNYALEEYIKQKPNRILILNRWKPYTGLYLRSKDRFDKEKFKTNKIDKIKDINLKYAIKIADSPSDSIKYDKRRLKKVNKINKKLKLGTSLMQSINEAPVWLNDSLTELSMSQLRLYMESNGYFSSSIDTSTTLKRKGRLKNIKYTVKANKPHLITNINYEIDDDNIKKLLTANLKNSFLKPKRNYRVQKISNERDRIFNLLKNNGYYDFHRQYISFQVDTTIKKNKVYLNVIIKNPAIGNHIQYVLSEVKVLIDQQNNELDDTLVFNDVQYYHNPEKKYSKKVLDQEIVIKPNELYNHEKTRFTKNNIGKLAIIKFVNINFIKKDSAQLVALVNLKTQKRFQAISEFGGNINVNSGQNIPGPYINFTLKDKKIFKGFESLELNGYYSIKAQTGITDQDSLFRSREFGSSISLNYPRLLIPQFIQKSNILKRQNPFANNIFKSTNFDISYTNTDRQEYTRSSVGVKMNYNWKKGTNEQYSFTPFEINRIETPYITYDFLEYLEDLEQSSGINLLESFTSSILSNMSFGYTWNSIDLTKNKNATLLRFGGELGGILPHYIDKITTNNDSIINLPFSKYFKITADTRKYLRVTKYSNLVFRLAGGYEKTILGSSFLPYEKFFFTGGVSSNRAWISRRIGPGNYNPAITNVDDVNFERPGEMLLEANLEYRTKIYGFLHTALFIDASNVWTNEKEQSREGTQFDISNIHKSIAIGAGSGIRLDFSLLIIRLDVGWKVFDPSTQDFVKFDILTGRANIGIGYPF